MATSRKRTRGVKKTERTKNGHLTNNDLFRLQVGLKDVGDLRGAKFGYAVAKNLRIVGAVCDDLRAAVKPSEAFMQYERARAELCKEHAEKDERGRPQRDDNEYVIADWAAFEKALEPLKAEHAEAIAAQDARGKDFETLLEEAAEVTLYTIPYALVPEDISAAQFDGIFEIVTGEPPADE